jgi:hypothetical protein
LGTHHIPPEFYKERYSDIADFAEKAEERSYVFFIGNYMENTILSCFAFLYNKNAYWVLHDKRNQVTRIAKSMIDDYNFKDDIRIELDNHRFVIDNDRLCFILQPSQLINLVKSSQSKKYPISDNVLKIYNNPHFTEQSNPIIVICKLKK